MEHPSSSSPRHAPHPAIERFVAACAADARVAAAFLTGSYAAGTADAHSDLDLGVITADAAYDDFLTSREPFVRLLGEPVFVETFAQPDPLFFILADGTEGELAVARARAYRQVANGRHWVLVDKNGELETVRRSCVGLVRLRRDFADAEAASECYYKVDTALPPADLEPLRQTLCSTEPVELLRAARAIVRLYQQLAPPLAQAHGISHPAALAHQVHERLERLDTRWPRA